MNDPSDLAYINIIGENLNTVCIYNTHLVILLFNTLLSGLR